MSVRKPRHRWALPILLASATVGLTAPGGDVAAGSPEASRYPAAFFCENGEEPATGDQQVIRETLVVVGNPHDEAVDLDVTVRAVASSRLDRTVEAGDRLLLACSDLPDDAGPSGFLDIASPLPVDVVATYQTSVTRFGGLNEEAFGEQTLVSVRIVAQLETVPANDIERTALSALGIEYLEPVTLLVLAGVEADGLLIPAETARVSLESALADELELAGASAVDALAHARRIVTDEMHIWVDLGETDIAVGDIAISIDVVPIPAAPPFAGTGGDSGVSGSGGDSSGGSTSGGDSGGSGSDDGGRDGDDANGGDQDGGGRDDGGPDGRGDDAGGGGQDGDENDDQDGGGQAGDGDDRDQDGGADDEGSGDGDGDDDQEAAPCDRCPDGSGGSGDDAGVTVVVPSSDGSGIGWVAAVTAFGLGILLILLLVALVLLVFWLTRRSVRGSGPVAPVDPPGPDDPGGPPAVPPVVPPVVPPEEPDPVAHYEITCAFEGEKEIDVDDREATLFITVVLRDPCTEIDHCTDAHLTARFDWTGQRIAFEGQISGELDFDLPDLHPDVAVTQALKVATGVFADSTYELPSADVGEYSFDAVASSIPTPSPDDPQPLIGTESLSFRVARD